MRLDGFGLFSGVGFLIMNVLLSLDRELKKV